MGAAFASPSTTFFANRDDTPGGSADIFWRRQNAVYTCRKLKAVRHVGPRAAGPHSSDASEERTSGPRIVRLRADVVGGVEVLLGHALSGP